MRIALCTDYFYPKIGGVTTHVEGLARELVRRGHDVAIFTKSAPYDDECLGLRVCRVNSFFRTARTLDVPILEELESALKTFNPDVVHGHHAFSPVSLFSISTGRRIGAKTILTNHSISILYNFDHLWHPSSYLLFPYRQLIGMADEVVAVSKAAATFISHFTDKEAKVIPNGICAKDFAPERKVYDGKSVLFVGRFSYRKGISLLLEAMREVISRQPDAQLTIAGAGSAAPLQLLVRGMGLNGNVRIIPNVERGTLLDLYRRSNVFVMPSIFGESFGIVLLEAMASGTPIVATNQGGISEVIKDGDNGFIVRKYRPDDMADAILAVLNDSRAFGRMSGECLASARRYDWSRVAGELESTYAN